jgi:adenylate kinase family enzyme
LARKRIDDNMDDINARLDFYYKDVVPTLEYYKNNSFYNYIHINGNKSIQEIFEEIKEKSGLEK